MDTPTETTFSNRCNILAEIWMGYRDDEQFVDFVEYNDLGLPLAYALANEIVVSTKVAEDLIDETWELLLGALDRDDTGFETLEEVFGIEGDGSEDDE